MAEWLSIGRRRLRLCIMVGPYCIKRWRGGVSSTMLSGQIEFIYTPAFIDEICEVILGQQHMKNSGSGSFERHNHIILSKLSSLC